MSRKKKGELKLEPLKIFISTPIKDQKPEQVKIDFKIIDEIIKAAFETSDDNDTFAVETVYADPEWLNDKSVASLGKLFKEWVNVILFFYR